MKTIISSRNVKLIIILFWYIPVIVFGQQTTTALSQYGISWTFTHSVEYGQFVNGDYWVIGPVSISAISPGWDGEKNGSMVNPQPGGNHGYDARDGGCYDSSLNVGLRAGLPLSLHAGSSLISSIGLNEEHDLFGRSFLTTAAILTVLDSNPGTDAFRPAYASGDKKIFHTSDIDQERIDALPQVVPVEKTPQLADIIQKFQRPWLDHLTVVINQHIHPVENMSVYSREIGTDVGEGALMLCTDQGQESSIQLLYNFLQVGIDLSGCAKQHRSLWRNNGGHSNGRKWPILFAAIMFDDDDMRELLSKSGDYLYTGAYGAGNIPPDYLHFGEDDQTFYVKNEDVYSIPYPLDVHGDTHFHAEGTVNVVNGNSTVQGVLTEFGLADSGKHFGGTGTEILDDPSEEWNRIDGKAYQITSVDVGNQTLTLDRPYRGTTQNALSYKIGTSERIHGWLWYGHGFSPGTYRKDYIEYTEADLNLPEWGIVHATSPHEDGQEWYNASYRRCCTAHCWGGYVLAAHMMERNFSAKQLWNHDALFDYMDRYVQTEIAGIDYSGNEFTNSRVWQSSPFVQQMWETYRNDYPPVWSYSQMNTIHTKEIRSINYRSAFKFKNGILSTALDGHFTIELYDAQGKILQKQENKNVVFSAYPHGFYIVKCISSHGVFVRKIVTP